MSIPPIGLSPEAELLPPGPQSTVAHPPNVVRIKAKSNRIGPVLGLALVWTLFEFGRPPTPPLLLLGISALLFAWWIAQRKKLDASDAWWFALIGVTAVGVVFAENTYSAFMSTRFFVVLFLGICLPFKLLLNTEARARAWMYAFIATAAYVGIWAITHGGYGPAGSFGHDENYVAAIVVTGAGLAYFCSLAERRTIVRLLLLASLVAFVGALAAANNPSRGGFLALCVVTGYAIYRSPRKMLAISGIVIGAVALFAFGGDTFWNEISTSTDYTSGTGDVRLELWKSGFRMWLANPVIGVGGGNFIWRIGDFQTAAQFEKFGRELGGSMVAHSMPVELLSELGLLGVVATTGLILGAWRGLGRMLLPAARLERRGVPRDLYVLSCYADALRAALLSILVNGVFLSLLYYSHLWVFIAASAALIHVHERCLARHPAALVPFRGAAVKRSRASRGGRR